MNRGSERFASSSAAAIARRSSGSRRSSFFQLAMAINQLLFTVSEGEEGDEVPMDDSATPAATHLEFKLGKLVLGHDSRHRKFIIDAHDEESADEAARIGLGERTVITKTLRRRVFALVGRITRSARRLTLHLPRRWPWETQFSRALARLQAIPFPA